MYEFQGLEKAVVVCGFVVALIIAGLFIQHFWL
jgi:hypothetical protein